ncbi:MAG: hypothetical protein Q4D16_19560 [Eubacteriales bacterium]|nr:hypothetical protein [Eubacteriales bacterium]
MIKEITGKTEQVQTTGAQLFNADRIPTKSAGGATLTNNGDGSFTITGSGTLQSTFDVRYIIENSTAIKLFKAGKLKCKLGNGIQKTTPTFTVQIENKQSIIRTLTNNFEYDLTQEIIDSDGFLVQVVFYAPPNTIIESETIKPIMYQDGNGDWEPYTGGKPSPSPDYPQDIWTVGENRNCFNFADIPSQSANGIVCTNNGDGSFTFSGTYDKKANVAFSKTYTHAETLKMFNSSGKYGISHGDMLHPSFYVDAYYNGAWHNGVLSTAYTTPWNITSEIINASDFYIRLGFYISTGLTFTPRTVYPQIYKGTNKPGFQACTQAPVLKVKCQGKNLFKNEWRKGDWNGSAQDIRISTDQRIFLKKGQKVTFSYNTSVPFEYGIIQLDLNGGHAWDQIWKSGTFTLSAEYDMYIAPVFADKTNKEASISLDNTKNVNMQIELGDTATPYTPYHHSDITIPLASPLYSGDKICCVQPGESYVDANGNTSVAHRVLWGVMRTNQMVVFDGSADEGWEYEVTNTTGVFRKKILKYMNRVENVAVSVKARIYSDCYSAMSANDTYLCKQGISVDDAGRIMVYDEAYNTKDTSLWNTHLKNNPLTVVFEIATPYFEPFADQSPLHNLRSADDLTYMYTNDPLKPDITVDVAKQAAGGYLLSGYMDRSDGIMVDATTGAECVLGMENGLLTVYEIEEE